MRDKKGRFVKNHKINVGRRHTKEWVQKRALSLKGRLKGEEVRKKISETNKRKKIEPRKKFCGKGEKNPRWKGEKVKYPALHQWVQRLKGSPLECEMCGRKVSQKRGVHWANIDHKYRRALSDYIRLCVSCHKKFDIENN